ncbi:PREDICTED: zinc finger protein 541 [Chrysochloris asiatica]|uniref:Zinc finger protein 541 n=1 Tax=Chrysochloris asiatica TaxID=185453 RepID=A0A9B0TX55_CHRAS|nr:PREDICTED: zinc finger protein 541 [Chrysochloris asiatica]
MEQYSLGDEGPVPPEMHLPSFSESQGLNCSDTLNRDLGPNTRDLLYAGLSGLGLDPSLPAPDMPSEVLEDNLDTLSVYSGKDNGSVKLLGEYADPESQTSLQDLGLGTLKVPKETDEGGGRASSGSTRRGKRQHSSPQSPLLDCSLCGKVFSSASSLSKHYLTHSQERKHICKICSKAFKRQDHLTGHMLTHQKTKPFVCIEQGCSKSYCDYRSLRRHYEVQHGLCILKEAPLEEEPCGDSPHGHEAPTGGLRALVPPEARSPSSLLPNRDLLRCLVSSIVHQKVPTTSPVPGALSDPEARGAAGPCPASSGSSASSACIPVGPGVEGPEEPRPPRKELIGMDSFTGFHQRVGENGVPEAPEPELPVLQLPATVEGWPDAGTLSARLPLFRSQTGPTSSQPPGPNFQWLRNLPGGPKNKGNSMFMVHKPPTAPAREGSESGPGPCGTSPGLEALACSGTGLEDRTPCPAQNDTRGTSGEENAWASKKSKLEGASESMSWQSPGDPSPQDAQKASGLPAEVTPLFRQLFLKSQESVVSHEQMQVFQMITKSQRIFSHAPVAAPATQLPGPETKSAALKPLSGPWPQQSAVDSLHAGPGNPEPEGSPARRRKTMAAFPREAASPVGAGNTRREAKGGPKVTTVQPTLVSSALDPSANPDVSSLAKQLRSAKGALDLGDIVSPSCPRQSQPMGDEASGSQLPGKQVQAENGTTSGVTRGDKGPACSRGTGYRLFSSHPRGQRFSGFRKEKVKMDMCCTASPSQVAMASFSSSGPPADPPQDAKSKLTIFNRIQGGNIYRLPHPVKEESMAGGCNQQNGGPADWTEPRNTYVCKNCSQMFYTEKGLSSHMCFRSDQWPSPRGKQEQQAFGASEFCKPPRQMLRTHGDGQSPPGAKKPMDSTAAAPLMVPVSVPVIPGTQPPVDAAKGQEKDSEESKESSQYRKQKKRPQPKALVLPAPPSAFAEQVPGGHHPSCLRSPVFLVDQLLKGLFQCPPYTPPPMLSPIREGSGLYFNTLCSTASQAGPHRLFNTVFDPADGSLGICVVKDDTKISIEPHINIGSRFQAEIPDLQERSLANTDERIAALVWKPWGDVMTNPETQDRVTELCNVACSSVMPGGGTNLELALHCLHEAQGNVQLALETLLLRGPQKSRTHPLADYRYTGSDIWTPMEKRLFKKAFCAHKKDFYMIHKTIQTKTVTQCVEYYYIWKKMIKFDCGRAPGLEKRVKREPEEVDRTEEKVTCSPRERPSHRPTPELKIKTKSYRRESILHSSPNTGPKRTPEPPGSVESQGAFPCRECERVFDKIKSRNAHMKRHRLQDHVEPIVRVKWPVKPFQLKEDEEEEEEMGADIGPLQW